MRGGGCRDTLIVVSAGTGRLEPGGRREGSPAGSLPPADSVRGVMIRIGIDEAGLGPKVGPLVISAVAFRFREPPAETLWHSLSEVVCRSRRQRPTTLVVDDSKTVYSPARGLGRLEETVLAFLAAAGVEEIESGDGKHDWARELADMIISLQRPDGSWVNSNDQWMEDDCVLVTAYCVRALSYCWDVMHGKVDLPGSGAKRER